MKQHMERIYLVKRHVVPTDCEALGRAVAAHPTLKELALTTQSHRNWDHTTVHPLTSQLQQANHIRRRHSTLLHLHLANSQGLQHHHRNEHDESETNSNNDNNIGYYFSTCHHALLKMVSTNYDITVALDDSINSDWIGKNQEHDDANARVSIQSRLNAAGRGRLILMHSDDYGNVLNRTNGDAWIRTLEQLNNVDNDGDNRGDELWALNGLYALLRMNPSLCQTGSKQ